MKVGFTATLTQPTITRVGSLSEGLSTLGWPVGELSSQPTVGGTTPYAGMNEGILNENGEIELHSWISLLLIVTVI